VIFNGLVIYIIIENMIKSDKICEKLDFH
jgi:hypothetical protein